MIGAIIGAGISAVGALANSIATKKKNNQIKKDLERRERAAESDAVADRYGDWRYSGANLYFNKAADEMKDYVAQQRASRNVTGAVDNGTAVKAAGQAIGNAAGQASAQRQAVGMQMAQQDKARAENIAGQINGVDAQQSAATTQAWTQLAQSAGNVASAIDSGASKSAVVDKPNVPIVKNEVNPDIKAGAGIDFDRAQTDLDYQNYVKQAIKGGL
jgi:hypothetical protein